MSMLTHLPAGEGVAKIAAGGEFASPAIKNNFLFWTWYLEAVDKYMDRSSAATVHKMPGATVSDCDPA
jgi:hypothetical protein